MTSTLLMQREILCGAFLEEGVSLCAFSHTGKHYVVVQLFGLSPHFWKTVVGFFYRLSHGRVARFGGELPVLPLIIVASADSASAEVLSSL